MSQIVTNVLCVSNILPGVNPRKYFDAVEMAELEASIAEKGVIQPILVRPVKGGYAVVAGERRVRAARKVLGDKYEIPVLVKEMTDAEADELALIENVSRANMSSTEEAVAAAKILGRCEGNRDEAAKRLGWTRKTLEKRLALMNCSPTVMDALDNRRILLGHAELLAAAPKDKQEKVIVGLLARPILPTVAEFKAGLESISQAMDAAIFDKTECAGCHHNSGNQQALFAEAVSAGHCTNSECFNKKTEGVLEAKKASLAENYPCVVIVRPGDNNTVIKLVAEGATGVGAEQASACRSCKSFGAAVSAVPGKMGNVYESQCFDSACHAKKVGERLLADKKAAEKPVTSPATGQSTDPKAAVGKGAEKSTTTPKVAVTTIQNTQRVEDYRVGIWRKALKNELYSDSHKNLCMLIGVMMTRGGSSVSSIKLASAFEKLTSQKLSIGNLGEAAVMVAEADEKIRDQMLSGIVISITDSIEKSYLPGMLKFMQVDLAKHWKLNTAFLELLTKSEIEVVAEEFGLKAALGVKYAKAISGKKDEMIKLLLAVEGFVYEGKVPQALQYATA
jgi:ParB family chromosome partitioning protein